MVIIETAFFETQENEITWSNFPLQTPETLTVSIIYVTSYFSFILLTNKLLFC